MGIFRCWDPPANFVKETLPEVQHVVSCTLGDREGVKIMAFFDASKEQGRRGKASASFLAEISVSSPRKVFIFII